MNKCIAFVDDDSEICRHFREMALMITVFNRLFGCQDRCLSELVDVVHVFGLVLQAYMYIVNLRFLADVVLFAGIIAVTGVPTLG